MYAAYRVLSRTASRASKRGSITARSASSTGLFGNPLFATSDGLLVASRKAREESGAVVDEILSSQTPEETVFLFDELSDTLCRTADAAECIRLVHPDSAFVETAGECCAVIGNYVEELNTHRGLHGALRDVTRSESFKQSQDEVLKRNVDSLMHDFEISGIHLSEGEREKVVELNAQILSASHAFVHNCTQPVLLKKAECPKHILDAYPSDGEMVYITHVPHSSPDSILRSTSYQLYHAIVPQQVELLESLLSLRHELATLVGYPSFAHRAIKTTTAESPERAQEFLDRLSEKILPLAKEELEEMLCLKKDELVDKDVVRPWDVTYLNRLAQQKLFPHLRDSDMISYFSLDSCIAGLSNLFHSLFGVSLQLAATQSGEIWHPSIKKYAVTATNGETLGVLYCDFFNRSDKAAGDCQFTIQGGRTRRDGSYQMPVVTLSLSLSSSHLSQQAVENLFHEMGHAIHSILGRSKYQNVSGTRCATDFAEVPSNLMEMFLSNDKVLASFALNSAHQPLPLELQRMFHCSESNMFPAVNAQTQIFYAAMDLAFHTSHPLSSTTTLFNELSNKLSPIQHPRDTAWFLRFNHLYAYAAKYYSYPWAHAAASLIWTKCFKTDPFSPTMGGRLRNMLSYGGGRHPMSLLSDMLGFTPSVTDLADAYVSDILKRKEILNNHKT